MPPRKSKSKSKSTSKPRQKRPPKTSQNTNSKAKDPLKPTRAGVTKSKNNPARRKRARRTAPDVKASAETQLANAIGELSLTRDGIQQRSGSVTKQYKSDNVKKQPRNGNALKKLNDAIQRDVGAVNVVISGFVNTKLEKMELDGMDIDLKLVQGATTISASGSKSAIFTHDHGGVSVQIEHKQPVGMNMEIRTANSKGDRGTKKRSATPKQQIDLLALNAQIQADAAVAQRDVAQAIVSYASR